MGSSEKKRIGLTLVKQLFDAVGYIKSINICHRDIKPSNILVNIDERKLKLSDFGSAIRIPSTINQQLEQIKKRSLQSYICSRYYRAPELLLGCSNYSQEIDTWSAGCVVAEMVMAKPLFPGESSVDMLVEIVTLLGPPSLDDLKQMNIKLEETDDDEEDDHETNLDNEIHEERYDASSLVELILSNRTFKTYQERLK